MIILHVTEPCLKPYKKRINPHYIIEYYPAIAFNGEEEGTTVVYHKPPKTSTFTVEEFPDEIDELINDHQTI